MVIYNNFDDVRSSVEEHDGILSVTMQELRDAHGVGRLGVHVRNAIRRNLANRGIGHFPNELPVYQHERVRLYIQGSQFADCLEDLNELSPEADERLRDLFVTNYEELIEQIRQLVCN